jgi:putative membrane protein
MQTAAQRLPFVLAAGWAALFLWSAINPASREVWIAELLPVVIVFAGLALSYRHFRFSNTAYLLMAVWLYMHTIGGHYTFAHVPFDWVTDTLGFERNHYDRVAHFSVGFYAYPIAEFVTRKRLCGPVIGSLLGLFAIMSIAAAYEIIEWAFAAIFGGDAGIEFLGVQGDVWDAQKDMLLDTCGALVAIALFWWRRPDRAVIDT